MLQWLLCPTISVTDWADCDTSGNTGKTVKQWTVSETLGKLRDTGKSVKHNQLKNKH